METNLKKASEILSDFLLLSSFPVAIKFSQEETLPEKVRRPLEALGHPVAVCQGVSMARSLGWSLGFLPEDHACPPSLVILGMEEIPPGFDMGEMIHPLYGETVGICQRGIEQMPMLPVGQYRSILLSSLKKATFTPDVILVYGNPAQVSRLIHGALYHRGGALTSSFLGRASCSSKLVSPMLTKECQIIVPGSGERVFASTQDFEMCFAIPIGQLDEVLSGLEITHKLGTMRFPTPFQGIREQPGVPDKYVELARRMGIKGGE